MTTTYTELIKGNTGPLYRAGVPSIDANGLKTGAYEDITIDYECTLAVPSAVPPIERNVTDTTQDKTRFLAQLTPAETATLPSPSAGDTNIKVKVAIQIKNENVSPTFSVEKHVWLKVKDGEIVTS